MIATSPRRWSAALVAVLVAGACLTATTPAAASTWSPNLIVNGGAEAGDPSLSGYSAVTIPGWSATGTPTVIEYGTSGFPTAADGPGTGGAQFFGGGDVATSTLAQTDSLSAAASAIDAGGVSYDLDGWLGGYGADSSDTTVTVSFRNAAGTTLATAQIGPVTVGNRFFATELLERQTDGRIPVGARSAQILVSFADANITGYNDAYADNLSLTISTAMPAPGPPVPPASTVRPLDHVFLLYLENKGDADILGSSSAPYINSLIAQNGYAANYFALTHPSDPNYIPILGGTDFGIDSNCALSCVQNAPNLTDNIETAGQTWKAYLQDADGPCDLTSHGGSGLLGYYYTPDELPFTYFSDIEANPVRCAAHLLPLTSMATDLASTSTTPNFVWFAANDYDDMEQGGIAAGDTWLSQTLPTILNSPAWKTQRSAIFITWDEDQDNNGLNIDNQGNNVPMIVLASPRSGMRQGRLISGSYYTHYSLLRTIENSLHLPPLTKNDEYATPMNDFWP